MNHCQIKKKYLGGANHKEYEAKSQHKLNNKMNEKKLNLIFFFRLHYHILWNYIRVTYDTMMIIKPETMEFDTVAISPGITIPCRQTSHQNKPTK